MTQTMHQMSTEMQQCIANCTGCHKVCTQMVAHCLGLGGPHASPEHITVLLDCAQACATSADFMLRMSPLHPRTCGLCAEACVACAEDCERLANGDQMMLECADICRRCAASCQAMASAA